MPKPQGVKTKKKRVKSMPLAMEQEVVGAARAGNQDAFTALYEYHRVRVLARAQQIVKNSADAEEVTNLAFAQAFSKLHQFQEKSRFSTWIYRIATNAALMKMRKSRYCPEFVSLDELQEVSGNKPNNLQHREKFQRALLTTDKKQVKTPDRVTLERAIEELPAGYKQAIILHDVLNYEHNEISEITGRTIGNSKSQTHKARQAMRKLLTNGQ